jgi:hypothetical protein
VANALESVRRFATRRRRWLVGAGVALVVYTGVGFILFPWVLHRELERRLGATLHREVSIQSQKT